MYPEWEEQLQQDIKKWEALSPNGRRRRYRDRLDSHKVIGGNRQKYPKEFEEMYRWITGKLGDHFGLIDPRLN